MRWLIGAIVAITLFGCGQHTIDHEFNDTLNSFIYDASKFNRHISLNDISIEFGDPPREYQWGYCDIYTNEITIKADVWVSAPQARKRAMLYHELGHCILHRKHVDSVVDICPNSIMNKDAVQSKAMIACEVPLLHELFNY